MLLYYYSVFMVCPLTFAIGKDAVQGISYTLRGLEQSR